MTWILDHDSFAWDGSWRDLYILPTTLHEWQQLLDFLPSSPYAYTFTIDGKNVAVPSSISTLFANRPNQSPCLTIATGQVLLYCYFFSAEQIEFDLDPRDVSDEVQFSYLLCFMRNIGQLLAREVRLTPENAPDVVLIRFHPFRNQIERG